MPDKFRYYPKLTKDNLEFDEDKLKFNKHNSPVLRDLFQAMSEDGDYLGIGEDQYNLHEQYGEAQAKSVEASLHSAGQAQILSSNLYFVFKARDMIAEEGASPEQVIDLIKNQVELFKTDENEIKRFLPYHTTQPDIGDTLIEMIEAFEEYLEKFLEENKDTDMLQKKELLLKKLEEKAELIRKIRVKINMREEEQSEILHRYMDTKTHLDKYKKGEYSS
jgi:hypothetical protein